MTERPKYIPSVMGRPPKFPTVESLQIAIDEYFESCWEEQPVNGNPEQTHMVQVRPYTITGLALSVGMTREGLLHYQAKDQNFADTVLRAKQHVETFTESALFNHKQQRGAEFALKNNYKGWEDKKTYDINAIHHIPTAQLEAERAQLVAEIKAEMAQEQLALPDPDVIDAEVE